MDLILRISLLSETDFFKSLVPVSCDATFQVAVCCTLEKVIDLENCAKFIVREGTDTARCNNTTSKC